MINLAKDRGNAACPEESVPALPIFKQEANHPTQSFRSTSQREHQAELRSRIAVASLIVT